MEENKEKELDALLKKSIKEIGLEEPPKDFTASILSKIEEQSDDSRFYVYKPLISTSGWVFMGMGVIVTFAYLVLGDISWGNTWYDASVWERLSNFGIFRISIPSTFVYGFLAMAIFMGIQVFLLKSHIHKRYFLN